MTLDARDVDSALDSFVSGELLQVFAGTRSSRLPETVASSKPRSTAAPSAAPASWRATGPLVLYESDQAPETRASRRSLVRMSRVIVVGVAACVAATAFALSSGAGADGSLSAASATLINAEGSTIGKVTLLAKGPAVQVSIEAAKLTPGFHGFHIHAVGRCEAAFTSAGGHHNPAGGNHAEHAGDLPVLLVGRDGTAQASFASDRFDIGALLDADGSSVIVHAAPDNYANIPTRYAPSGPDAATLATGDSGGRVACGVLSAGTSGGEGSGRGR